MELRRVNIFVIFRTPEEVFDFFILFNFTVELLGISFTNDDALIVSFTRDSFLRVYDVENDEEVSTFRPVHARKDFYNLAKL
jgi:hypothetical protein